MVYPPKLNTQLALALLIYVFMGLWIILAYFLQYGTPYLNNEGLWRIDVKVPPGRAWSLAQEIDLQLEPLSAL